MKHATKHASYLNSRTGDGVLEPNPYYKTLRTLCNRQLPRDRVVGSDSAALSCVECKAIIAEYEQRQRCNTPGVTPTCVNGYRTEYLTRGRLGYLLAQLRLDFYHAKHGMTILPMNDYPGNAWARELLTNKA